MNNDATKAETVTMTKEALAALLAEAAKSAEKGHRQWATKSIADAAPKMILFTNWIAREFPELEIDSTDEKTQRLVMIASKAYGAFQKSDMNK